MELIKIDMLVMIGIKEYQDKILLVLTQSDPLLTETLKEFWRGNFSIFIRNLVNSNESFDRLTFGYYLSLNFVHHIIDGGLLWEDRPDSIQNLERAPCLHKLLFGVL